MTWQGYVKDNVVSVLNFGLADYRRLKKKFHMANWPHDKSESQDLTHRDSQVNDQTLAGQDLEIPSV